MLYVENVIPDDQPKFRVKDALRLRIDLKTKTFERKGVLRWKSNNAVVPPHRFKGAFCTLPAAQDAAYEQESEAAINAYVRNNIDRAPSPDEINEARVTHGPGVTLVNVLTGNRFCT